MLFVNICHRHWLFSARGFPSEFPSGHSGTSGIAVPLPLGCPALRVPRNARGVLGCALRFRPREFPPSTKKIALKAIFICISPKIIVSLHPQFHAGEVCASSAGVADILKRRLLTLCSDALKLRNFHICIQDLATVDVLRDIDYPPCAYWCGTPFAYMRMRTRVP